ncbi:MAG TPA: sec-independent translocase [Mycobacteriales bacterium]|nr:sec-independent translocase [Mycobacteriales bacterium]
MFSNVGWPELAVIALVGVFLFGPDRLPKMAKDAARLLRQLRRLADDATAELRADLGPEFQGVADLHPRRLMRRLLDNEEADGQLPAAVRAGGEPLAPGESAPFDVDAT